MTTARGVLLAIGWLGGKLVGREALLRWSHPVRGPIPPAELGRALVHEHVLCDFIGAEKTGPHRYDAGEVQET